jgi:hypothetical protein
VGKIDHSYESGRRNYNLTFFKEGMPDQSAACSTRLDEFFTQWFDTAYPPGGGANRPQLTGPGLAGPGFCNADGICG